MNMGFVGSFLLAICALPLAIAAHKEGRDVVKNDPFIFCWMGGELCLLYHVLFNVPFDLPLILNYSVNVLLLSIVLKYRLFPRRKLNGPEERA